MIISVPTWWNFCHISLFWSAILTLSSPLPTFCWGPPTPRFLAERPSSSCACAMWLASACAMRSFESVGGGEVAPRSSVYSTSGRKGQVAKTSNLLTRNPYCFSILFFFQKGQTLPRNIPFRSNAENDSVWKNHALMFVINQCIWAQNWKNNSAWTLRMRLKLRYRIPS